MKAIIQGELFCDEAGIVGLLVKQEANKQELLKQCMHQYAEQLGKSFVLSSTGLDLMQDETVLQNMRYRLQQAGSKVDWLAQIDTMLGLAGFVKSHHQKLVRDCSVFEQQMLRLVYAMLTNPGVVVITDYFILSQLENKQLRQMLTIFQETCGTHFVIVLDDPQSAVLVDKFYVWNDFTTILVKKNEWSERHAQFLAKS
ncbi:hypothetical protein [Culicoidibacter larvae]|uniref:ABC transporter domain-containing protein n=1 Tax=Culicoidibacter larvae TaxID=2579976 RepID=A0A5R8QGZ5_9FIRM|nr:hypothetical protein [Culicoidibacter larvae]TLG76733.1 hypothetical protein FEZ08_03715 [Culicoidibacter larvae]